MDFEVNYSDMSKKTREFSTKPMEDLINAIASHRLSSLFFPAGIPAKSLISVTRHGNNFSIFGHRVKVELNKISGMAKIILYVDTYCYEVDVVWDEFDPVEILDQLAEVLGC